MARSGLRGVVAPMFRSARWFTKNGHVVEYEWERDGGEAAFAAALAVLDEAARHPSGRMSGMVAPSQIDTCTAELVRASHAEALRRSLPWQIHAGQSVVEFHEITRRHGMTPIEWLASLGVLSDRSIVGHGIFLDHHTSAHWPKRDDLADLVSSRAFVAHCPTVFQRRGIALQTLGGYLRRGVRIGIGTDTYPHNMIEELRHAAIMSRTLAGSVHDVTTADVFHAATIGGAEALGRADLGRIAVGAKADLVLIDTTHPLMRPVRDPLRSMVYAAGERAIRSVFVDGTEVVADGRVLTMDHASRRCASSTGRPAATRRSRRSHFPCATDQNLPIALMKTPRLLVERLVRSSEKLVKL
jgi:5-methylthioadenosine/S-adenosylhomocysteine deaminase